MVPGGANTVTIPVYHFSPQTSGVRLSDGGTEQVFYMVGCVTRKVSEPLLNTKSWCGNVSNSDIFREDT